jgi:capsular exopolysaccharide synthesis family protein
MERLQAAIEKARIQRASTRPATPQSSVSKSAPANIWTELPELIVDEKALVKKRVFFGGSSLEASYFDKLRTKILQLCSDNGWTRIVITSPTKGCGKTTTSCNLAASFSRQRDRKLMLFDMDMRRPEMARTLGMDPGAGFSDVLEGKAEIENVAKRLKSNVVIAANLGPHPNPAQLILQDQTPQILDEIQARYSPDIMLFDAPPLMATDETSAMLKFMDCAILVAAAEMTTMDQVDTCEKEIAEQTNVLGVVLNRCNYLDPSEKYGYRY